MKTVVQTTKIVPLSEQRDIKLIVISGSGQGGVLQLDAITFTLTPIHEPATFSTILLGGGLLLMRRRA